MNKEDYLNFLCRITEIITSRLPKIAATIIKTITDAFKTSNKLSVHSGSSSDSIDDTVDDTIVKSVVDDIEDRKLLSGDGVGGPIDPKMPDKFVETYSGPRLFTFIF